MADNYATVCLNIVEIFRYYCGEPISYNKSKDQFTFTCPICGKRKLGVSKRSKVAHCFVCDSSWNSVKFIADIEDISINNAIDKGLSILSLPTNKIEAYELDESFDETYKDSSLFISLKLSIYMAIYNLLYKNSSLRSYYRKKLFGELDSQFYKDIDIVISKYDDDIAEILKEEYSSDVLKLCPGFYEDSKGKLLFSLNNHILFPYWDSSHSHIVGFNGRVKKDYPNYPRYKWLSGESKKLYFPKKVGLDNAMMITEGEKKAIVATSFGIPTVAVAGINCFKVKDILDLSLVDKALFICYDRDTSNPRIEDAEIRLASYLNKKGGYNSKIIHLPDGYKLDDFLYKFGVDALKTLMDNTQKVYYA